MSDVRRPLPSEVEVQNLAVGYERKFAIAKEEWERKIAIANEECKRQSVITDEWRNEYQKLFQTRGLRLIRWVRKLLGITGVR